MAVTQEELYATLDLELSWSERELPEHVRTKHVHRLHPYHGKFIPQLVEVLLDRYLPAGGHVLDPFAGSGTTLVQALESGMDATGTELAAFNCLLMQVKTERYDVDALAAELHELVARLETLKTKARPNAYMRSWYSATAAKAVACLQRARALRRAPGDPLARAPALPVAPRTSTSRRRGRRRSASTGVTSTGAPAGRSSRRTGSSAATRSTPSRGSRPSAR